MRVLRIDGIDDLPALIGREDAAISDWLQIDQARIDAFAATTGDQQWIHVDVERAQRESPFGSTIAHGYLVLSLLAHFALDAIVVDRIRLALNYGLNRVRFTSPVPVGSRVRARFMLREASPIDNGVQTLWIATIDIEAAPKPACVAELISRWYI